MARAPRWLSIAASAGLARLPPAKRLFRLSIKDMFLPHPLELDVDQVRSICMSLTASKEKNSREH